MRDNVIQVDVAGSADGNGLADNDLGPDDGTPGDVLRDLEGVCVRIIDDCAGACTRDDCTFTDALGDFIILHEGSSAVDVEALFLGRWVTVVNDEGNSSPPVLEALVANDVLPPGPVDFTFNDPSAQFGTSQVNAFSQINRLHDFFVQRQPGFTELDCSITAEVNSNMGIGPSQSQNCNAAFFNWGTTDNQSTCDDWKFLAFHDTGGGCYNMAFSTVIAHEYAHFVVSALPNGPESSGGAFGEGFADSLAIVFYDTHLIAEGYRGPGTYMRNYFVNRTYPCTGADHVCGMVLGGVWWDTLENIGVLSDTQRVFAAWTLITDEPPVVDGQNNSADPGTAIEVLMADDIEFGDGDLSNGTPHQTEICLAFQKHRIPCVDCNRNGIWDTCDITGNCGDSGDPCFVAGCGESSDNTGPQGQPDGIPDECQNLEVLFVKPTGTATTGCASWPTACGDLQDALVEAATAPAGQITQIWVAAGEYMPDQGVNQTPGDRAATFQLLYDTEVYGGFEGDESDLNERDFLINVTILSGDLDDDDGPDFTNNADNTYHVVTGSGTDATAILDGFTVTGGHASFGQNYFDYGGGMYNDEGSPTLRNCIFDKNKAVLGGGGMYNRGFSAPTLTNCFFTGNVATYWPQFSDGNGGGMFNAEGSSPTLIDCEFEGNTTRINGGAMYSYEGSSLFEVHAVLINCKFRNNHAGTFGSGGGIYLRTGFDSGVTRLTDCTFIGNTAKLGGGMYIERGRAWFTNCKFFGNVALTGNTQGGALWAKTRNNNLRLVGCLFSGNTSDRWGGAIYLDQDDLVSEPLLTNCTFSLNKAYGVGGQGGGIYNKEGNALITNCVFWGNEDTFIGGVGNTDESAQIDVFSDVPVVTYSLIQGLQSGGPFDDPTNTADDPDFADPLGDDTLPGTEDDNLRIQEPESPVIDKGDDNAVPMDLQADLDGQPRILGDFVDIGAYEYIPVYIVQGAEGVSFNGYPGPNTNNAHAFSGYIDPRAESNNGVHVNLGIYEITIVFSQQVVDLTTGGALSAASFSISETGAGLPPVILEIEDCVVGVPGCDFVGEIGHHHVKLCLDRRITLQEWTTFTANVQDLGGHEIRRDCWACPNPTDHVDVGFLPCDVDQTEDVDPFDLLLFRQYVNEVVVPGQGIVEDYTDINRSGELDPFDLLRFRQLILGVQATQPWAGETMKNQRPSCCP